jgi:60 kDa SS-A/Ro ribonucleoprotein
MKPADLRPDTFNEAHAPAHALGDRGALAQLACTGMLQPVYYASTDAQQSWLVSYGMRVEPAFLAKTALYARRHGFLKETPALLCALLAKRDGALLKQIFHQVIDTGPMLRKFVGHLRSGAIGRRSLGRRPRELVHEWFARRTDAEILRASVGNSPSLADVLRLAHVKPHTPQRAALFGYLLGREVDDEALPELVRQLRHFQRTGEGEVPDVPFQLLTATPLGAEVWSSIARRAGWTMTRMNLNTFARHGVFADRKVVRVIASRLAHARLVRQARAMPFQLLTARKSLDPAVPVPIRRALDRALERSLAHVPALPGQVHICVDISGSMQAPLSQRGRTTCLDVAAMFAAALLRKNPEATLLLFDTQAKPLELNVRQQVGLLAEQIGAVLGGGTDCSAPLRWLNQAQQGGDLVVLISDQESWVDMNAPTSWASQTPLVRQWQRFRERSPRARLVCLDLQPYRSVQAPPSWDILHVGGFSDEVFAVIGRFLQGRLGPEAWLEQIEAIDLGSPLHVHPRPPGTVPSGMRS